MATAAPTVAADADADAARAAPTADARAEGDGSDADRRPPMPSGSYVGESRDKKPHGHGVATSPGGAKYEGEWKDDKRIQKSAKSEVRKRCVLASKRYVLKKSAEESPHEAAKSSGDQERGPAHGDR